jgi:hypothetical protein
MTTAEKLMEFVERAEPDQKFHGNWDAIEANQWKNWQAVRDLAEAVPQMKALCQWTVDTFDISQSNHRSERIDAMRKLLATLPNRLPALE